MFPGEQRGVGQAGILPITERTGAMVAPIGRSLREQLDIPIRVVIALLAGIALAFILDYLDTSVRDARDAESLGLRVVGEIPKPRTR